MKRCRRRINRKTTIFGVELTKLLISHNITQIELAERISRGREAISSICIGVMSVSPEMTDKICDALQVDEQTRYRMHISAARDVGYKIPVTFN